MRVFEETSKIQNSEMIHPSDKKDIPALEKREQAAKKLRVLLIHYFIK